MRSKKDFVQKHALAEHSFIALEGKDPRGLDTDPGKDASELAVFSQLLENNSIYYYW